MSKSEENFGQTVRDELRAQDAARQVLGIGPGAGPEALKAAYHRAALAHHPDRNPKDRHAARKFQLVKCAYELLAHGRQCGSCLEELGSWPGGAGSGREPRKNAWQYFLWWQESYFIDPGPGRRHKAASDLKRRRP